MSTVPPNVQCPSCAAHRIVGHPAGVLTFDHSAFCPIGAAEDGRRVADSERLRPDSRYPMSGSFERSITNAEAQLFGAMSLFPTVRTIVTALTGGGAVIRRSWAGIEEA